MKRAYIIENNSGFCERKMMDEKEVIDVLNQGFTVRKRKALFDNEMLVTFGSRAAYMHCRGNIEINNSTEGEEVLAIFAEDTIAAYKQKVYNNENVNFDFFIETALLKEFGKK